MAAKKYIGTSGWSYKGWKDNFYPPKLADTEMLAYYSKIFDSVELNSSFYHLPTKSTIAKWVNNTPKNFIFSCKASRYLTHIKKLSDYQSGITNLFSVLDGFGHKIGPILFQLPPRWSLNIERLEQFITALPSSYHYTFEFRDQSWLCPPVFDLLSKHQMALCFYDYKGFQAPEIITSSFLYFRLHGPDLEPYKGHYGKAALNELAKKMNKWSDKVNTIYCYFDNDQKVCAPYDANYLKDNL